MTLDSICNTCNKPVTETLLNAIYTSLKQILSIIVENLLVA